MKGNQEPMLYTTNAAVASLNHVPGFDPLKFLRRTTSSKTGDDVMRLDLRYKKLWFRLACPMGRLKLNALRITEKMAIFEAKVYRDREDAEPLSSYVANCTLDTTPGGLYVEAAQEEALDTALSNAGFGIQFADVGSESEEYGSEVPAGAKAEIAEPVQVKTVAAKPVQTKAEVTESVQKQPEAVKIAPQEPVKADPLDAIMADDMPVPEQVTAEVIEKPKPVKLESVQPAQTQAEPPQNVIVLEQKPPAAPQRLQRQTFLSVLTLSRPRWSPQKGQFRYRLDGRRRRTVSPSSSTTSAMPNGNVSEDEVMQNGLLPGYPACFSCKLSHMIAAAARRMLFSP